MNAPSSTCTTNDFISAKLGSVSDPTYMVNMHANGVNFDLSTMHNSNNPAPRDAKVTCLYINKNYINTAPDYRCTLTITDINNIESTMNDRYEITIPPLDTIRKITSSCKIKSEQPKPPIDGYAILGIFLGAVGLSFIVIAIKYFWDKRANTRLLAKINAQEGLNKGGYFGIGE